MNCQTHLRHTRLIPTKYLEENGIHHQNLQQNNVLTQDRKRALARMIATCQLPLSFAHSNGFIEFMKIVEPGYQVPYPQAIHSRLELAYEEIKQRISENITKTSFVAILLQQTRVII